MTVEELIEELREVADPSLPVLISHYDRLSDKHIYIDLGDVLETSSESATNRQCILLL